MATLLVIDNYDSFTYNLVQYLQQIGASVHVVRNDAISTDGLAKLDPAGIVISPGPGNPDGAGISLDTVKRFSGRIPILGVCLGHQAIAEAYGGRIRNLHFAVLNPPWNLAVQTGGHTDQSFAVLSQDLFIDPGLVVKPFKLSDGRQFT